MKLAEFVGNRRLVDLLKRRGVPQASMFVGPSGVGKKTCALALASLANCKGEDHSGTKADLCGRCPSCVKAAAGNHPDIRLYGPEGAAVRIDAMREMRREVVFRPFEGRLRFFVVDEAEKMTEAAANSILKTLEEPPATSRLVLATSKPELLLETIRSRCQVFRFKPLSREEIALALRAVEADRVQLRASFAEGSIARALELDLESLLEDRDRILDLLESWEGKRSYAELYRRLEEEPLRSDLRKRDRVRTLLDRLQSIAEDLYFLHAGTPLRIVNSDVEERLRRLSASLTPRRIRKLLEGVAESQREVDRYVNPLMCFETLWLEDAL